MKYCVLDIMTKGWRNHMLANIISCRFLLKQLVKFICLFVYTVKKTEICLCYIMEANFKQVH